MNRLTRHQPTRSRWRRWAGGLLLALPLALPLAMPVLAQVQENERPARVAYVDMRRLLDNAPQTLAAKEKLTREFAARDEVLKVQMARLQELEARQRDQADLLSSVERERLNSEIETLRRSIDRTRARMVEDLSRRTREESDRAWPEVNEAVETYARENNIDLVVASPVVYVSARIDITDRVLDLLRAQALNQGEE